VSEFQNFRAIHYSRSLSSIPLADHSTSLDLGFTVFGVTSSRMKGKGLKIAGASGPSQPYNTIQYNTNTKPICNAPISLSQAGHCHLISVLYGSFGAHQSAVPHSPPKTGSQSVYQFLHGTPVWPTHRHTQIDRPRYVRHLLQATLCDAV